MSRRPLVACLVTTAVGALTGALLGAIVGRAIAFFGDQTIQSSVPMVFCGTLGYFVGGASAAKGSLERFGARRAGLGSVVAAVLLVVFVGGASLARTSGPLIAIVALVAIVAAAVAATAIARPQEAPVKQSAMAATPRPPKEPKEPKVKKPRRVKTPKSSAANGSELLGLLSEDEERDADAVEPTRVHAAPEPYRPRASAAARRVPTAAPDPAPDADLDDENWEARGVNPRKFAEEIEDWEPDDEAEDVEEFEEFEEEAEPEPEPEPEPLPEPAPRPRRSRPLKAREPEPSPDEPAALAPRPRRDRPLRKGDA